MRARDFGRYSAEIGLNSRLGQHPKMPISIAPQQVGTITFAETDWGLGAGFPINQELQPILTRYSCAIATADSLMNVELDAILFSYVIFG